MLFRSPEMPVVGFAGDGAFGISMNEMSSCAREEWPAVTIDRKSVV